MVAAVLFVAFAVKLMDDFMDLRHDVQLGVPSLAERLGEATLPYALMLLAMAALFDPRVAIPLFTASYAVGMALDLNRMLPSGLYGWQEALIAVVLGVALAGPIEQLWSVVAIGFVQCVDDIQDAKRDVLTGSSNLVRRFGVGEVRMAAFALLCLAAWLRPIHTATVVSAVAAVEAGVWRLATYRPRHGSTVPRGWFD